MKLKYFVEKGYINLPCLHDIFILLIDIIFKNII